MDLNQPAADFELPDLDGAMHKLSLYRGKIAILNFWSATCPHSERTDRELLRQLERWNGNAALLSIASNRSESAQAVAEAANARRIPAILLDSQQWVADLYGAVTTPHVFVVDREGILRYRGAVDNITFRHRTATRFFLQEAVETMLQGDRPAVQEAPPYGCTIVREI